MDLNFKLEVYEGPLDLLLHLLEKNKVNIYDIPIVEITNQYLEYIKKMQDENLDIMSEFLVMAATLVDIKSRMLLPKQDTQEDEEDPRDELVRQLLEYKMYKMMAYELKDRQKEADRIYYKEPTIPDEVAAYEEPVDIEELLKDVTMEKLNDIFKSVLIKQDNKIDRTRADFGKIPQEEVSLDEKLAYLDSYAKTHKSFGFRSLLEKQGSKMEVIVCFLAVLEMMKSGKIVISQKSLFDEIMIESNIA